MCFRPSTPTHDDCNDGNHVCCPTCGMPVDAGMSNCPYCGDPIPPQSPDDYSQIDPSYSTRIL